MSAAAVASTVARPGPKAKGKAPPIGCPSLSNSPLKRSFFAAKFLATPPNAIYTIYIADGVTIADWAREDMHEFLLRRQWGQWLLREDKLCRMVVAVFWTAYDAALDKTAEEQPNAIDLMPYAGPNRPLSITTDHDWIAPHLMNQIAGVIQEHGSVPERQAKVLNALVDPFKNRRLALHVGFVIFINAVMWVMFVLDVIFYDLQGGEPEQADEDTGGGSGNNATDTPNNGTDAPSDGTNTTYPPAPPFPPPMPPSPPAPPPPLIQFDEDVWPLKQHGVRPLTAAGLEGVPAMPFLHADINHIAANTAGFLVFGIVIVLKHGMKVFCMLSIWLWFFAGFGTWLVARPNTNHIGASGIIFGYFGYILFVGILKLLGCPPSCRDCRCSWDSLQDLVIAIIIAGLYGGMIYGALPSEDALVSWEGHLMGFIGGVFFAGFLA
eukprot:CAMPEP_0206013164 /NCGR_PEP_ID=MMETSP1464-20131121/16025_1 /ASSEMBLY_ACC=CAM_ASM_001124 /TAXON_ID=119497 /ORGANISM="Exanthemachrysis gayraliae, Strain RCC1523" /LENGTH=436 /DNA_ID=CAMNT_0053386875 /DNA_START=10 /DNA_END=1317 /DNA_ORIENTATION=+